MKIFADLHLHGKYSRATSKALDVPNLEKYSREKGLNLLGTGDFTHPKWLAHLKSELTDNGSGVYSTKTGFNFVLSTELSFAYTQGGTGRRVHHIILAPSFEVVDQISSALLKKGRLDYDGRPIFGFSSIELADMMMQISPDIEIIPAHIWTPWFGLLGSKTGFNSVEECFLDRSKHIHAIETGLSSDPAMNWRLSKLDRYTILSNSDSHSYWPWRIGRECNELELKELSYKSLLSAIRTKQGLTGTIEVDPGYGKYHFDGHRAHKVSMPPAEALKLHNICPVCHRELTIGVLHRVEELADRPEGFVPPDSVPFKSMIPLAEVLSELLGNPVAGKKTLAEYYKIVKHFGSELKVMLDAPREEIAKITDERIANAIIKNRQGKIKVEPGYDGEYGYPVFEDSEMIGKRKERKEMDEEAGEYADNKKDSMDKKQKGLSDFF
jgi:uncharacterized protein (TIGR00375 family)